MALPLRFHPLVHQETQEAYAWYEGKKSGLGEDFKTAIIDLLDEIQASPEKYPIEYKDIRCAMPKRFPYLICYRIDDTHVEIIAIVHGARDPKTWQTRK